MSSLPNDNDRNVRLDRAFLKKAEACDESSGYWQETTTFLNKRVLYFKDCTRRNGVMRATIPPEAKAIEKFIEEFNYFISILDCLNDCISIKSLIKLDHWQTLSNGIEEAKGCWTSKVEGRLSEYLQKRQQNKSAREQHRFEAMDAIQSFSKCLEKTFRELK